MTSSGLWAMSLCCITMASPMARLQLPLRLPVRQELQAVRLLLLGTRLKLPLVRRLVRVWPPALPLLRLLVLLLHRTWQAAVGLPVSLVRPERLTRQLQTPLRRSPVSARYLDTRQALLEIGRAHV